MNSQEGKDVGNDRSECTNANPTQSQQSTPNVSSTTLSEDTGGYSSFWQQRCHYRKKAVKFQPHWQKKYSWKNCNSVTNGMLCQYCSHIYKEDRDVLKRTQGAGSLSQCPTGKRHWIKLKHTKLQHGTRWQRPSRGRETKPS